MPMTTDPLTLLVRALDQTEAIIVGIRDDQSSYPRRAVPGTSARWLPT